VIPVGYLAKFVAACPEWLKAERVRDLYSFSDHGSKDFEDGIEHWSAGEFEATHNGYRLFDSPEIIRQLAGAHQIDLAESHLFYYEVDGLEYDEDAAQWYSVDPPFPTPGVVAPSAKRPEGYDVVAMWGGVPACSPLCCNRVATVVETNEHCLLPSLERARELLSEGKFDKTEPGPFQIFAICSVDWHGMTSGA
jgi:hypothetical protein